MFISHYRQAILAGVLACASSVSAAVIDVQAVAKPSAGLIRLGDIAHIDDADPQLQRELQAVSLGPAPAPGRKLRITQQGIRERLLAHGVNLTEIEFAGQSLIILEGPSHEVAKPKTPNTSGISNPIAVRPWVASPMQRTQAEKAIQTAFHRQFQSGSTDIGPLKLKVVIAERDVAILTHTPTELIQFVEPGLEWGGPQTLTAQFPQADGKTQIVRMQAWINETPQIVTVKHAVPKGQVLRNDDLITMPAQDGQTGLGRSEDLIGQEAARALRPGAPLQPTDLTKTLLVRNNDLVTVRVRARGLSVSRILRAIAGGGEGDVINLVAMENPREKVQARVTGWHEAEIVTPGGERATTPAESSSRTFPASAEPLKFRGDGK